ncbi:MAG: dihydroorotase [Saprospiraceae bacterium]
MEYIFKNVQIIDPQSAHHLKNRDVWIKDGKIQKIASKIESKDGIILESKNSCIAPSWVDLACFGGEPGFEERESLTKLSEAALAGGYSRICYMPNTNPAIHSKSEVHFLNNISSKLGIHLHPIGSVSKNNAALEMAEILQMNEAGAVAFSDGNQGIQKSGLLKRTLEYLKLIPKSILINHSFDSDLSPNAQVHESEHTAILGLRSNPSIAEFSAIQKDISILEYTDSRLLLNKISCSESVSIIRKSKKTNPGLFTSVSIFNLFFTDRDLAEFPVNLKLIPPLRSTEDQKELWKGLKDGTIDVIVSDHSPMNPELKDLEFQNAAFGAISLETAFSLFVSSIKQNEDLELWIQKVSINPRQILSLPKMEITEGMNAEITWFNPNTAWKYSSEQIKSLSKNSPLVDKELKGKILAVFNKSKLFRNN